jgi:gas vesicle protein
MQLIQKQMDLFRKARETDLVANATQLKQWAQDIKDIYYQLMCHQASMLTDDSLALAEKAEALQKQLDAYPHAWNEKIYSQISTLEKKLQQFATLHIDLKGWSVKCSNSGMLLRDIAYQQQQLKQDSQDVDIWETAIVTEDPKPKPVPAPTPTPGPTPGPTSTPPMPKPVERKMRSKMPKGSCSVGQYRDWLKQQLAMTNKFGDTDVLNFDE